MKRINIISMMILFLGGMGLNSCKNPGEGITIDVHNTILKAPIAIRFVNAVKNAAHQPESFPVTIGGKDAALVVTMTGKTVYRAAEGVVFLALKKGIVPSDSDPILFTVAAEVPGFGPTTHTFRITKDKPLSIVIPVVEYANPVFGTTVKTQDNPLVAGVTVPAFVIQTPVKTASDQLTTISIAAGTQFLNGEGKLINASKLESRVVNYGLTSSESLSAIPGGFNKTGIIGENGQPIPTGVAFISAGFLAIDMSANGTAVSSFSKPLNVKMGISKTVLNPITGVKVKAGDVLPVWNVDSKTGHWTFESYATIVADGIGLSASFSATHLSYWNLGWPLGLCANELTLTFDAANYIGDNYSVGILSDNGYASSTIISITDQSTTEFQVPTGNIKVVVKDVNNVVLAETPYFDACASGNMVVNMPKSPYDDVLNVDLLLSGTCPGKSVNEKLSTWLRVYELSKGVQHSRFVYMLDGKINLSVRNNTKYVIEALYGEAKKSSQILFSKTNFSFSGSISGTSVYMESARKLVVEAQFPLPDCK